MKEATYKIIKKIGEGSGGIVYLAYHTRLKTEVVLKEIKNVTGIETRREVDILKKLHHSYLPQVFDFFNSNGKTFTVMTYISGNSLQDVFSKRKKISVEELTKWGLQISSALDYLHTQNPPIIHSDIKPGNIMLTDEGNICLIDFNISFLLDGTQMLGYTKGYSSPEQMLIATSRDFKSYSIDDKSDIFSVGATLYYLATGEKYNIKSPHYKLLSKNTSEAFCAVIKKCLAYKKEDRYKSANEMYNAFKDIPKKDKGYDIIVKTYKISQGITIGILALSIVLGGFGIHRLKLEQVQKYNYLVEQQENYRKNREYDKEKEVYLQAIQVLSSSYESYYQNALTLYEQREYSKVIEFIEYDVLKNEDLDFTQDRLADFYYVEGNAYFYLGKFDKSVEAFEKMYIFPQVNDDYYKDYIAALAYSGETQKADEKLNEAIAKGMRDDYIFYARGEISKTLHKDSEALTYFTKCILNTENNELKERSYVLMYDIYHAQNDDSNARKCLKEAIENLPIENQMVIIERLIQVNINLANKYNESIYQKEAIDYLNKVINNGWDTYETYDTLVIIHEKMKNLNKASQYLKTMTDKYGEDYNINKRRAFLEIDKQEQLKNSQRNYQQFEKYYKKAKELYRKEESQNDSEMSLLDMTYKKIVAGGWL